MNAHEGKAGMVLFGCVRDEVAFYSFIINSFIIYTTTRKQNFDRLV